MEPFLWDSLQFPDTALEILNARVVRCVRYVSGRTTGRGTPHYLAPPTESATDGSGPALKIQSASRISEDGPKVNPGFSSCRV